MQETNFNNKKYRRFIYRNKTQRELQTYLEKSLWNEIKLFSIKYNLSQSEIVRSLIISSLASNYIKEKFEESK